MTNICSRLYQPAILLMCSIGFAAFASSPTPIQLVGLSEVSVRVRLLDTSKANTGANVRLTPLLQDSVKENICAHGLEVKEAGFPLLFVEVEVYQGRTYTPVAVAVNIELCELVTLSRAPQPSIPKGCAVTWQTRLLTMAPSGELDSVVNEAVGDLVREFLEDVQAAENYRQRIGKPQDR